MPVIHDPPFDQIAATTTNGGQSQILTSPHPVTYILIAYPSQLVLLFGITAAIILALIFILFLRHFLKKKKSGERVAMSKTSHDSYQTRDQTSLMDQKQDELDLSESASMSYKDLNSSPRPRQNLEYDFSKLPSSGLPPLFSSRNPPQPTIRPFDFSSSPTETSDDSRSASPSDREEESFMQRRSYTKTLESELDVQGEIASSESWRRHTRVYGGGVCLACVENERRGAALAAAVKA